jgi:hypothetical protein
VTWLGDAAEDGPMKVTSAPTMAAPVGSTTVPLIWFGDAFWESRIAGAAIQIRRSGRTRDQPLSDQVL